MSRFCWAAIACLCVSAAYGEERSDSQPAAADSAALSSKVSPTLVVKTGLSPGIPRRLARAAFVKDVSPSVGAPVVYVFTDPQCPYCHRLWKQIRSMKALNVEF